MKKFKTIIILFLTLVISTISDASNQKATIALSANAQLSKMSPLDLPASIWQEAHYYCSRANNIPTKKFIFHNDSDDFYHKALLGVLNNNTKKQKINDAQKGLNAQKINGVLTLYHPKDCPGYEEDGRIYEKPEREKYL